MTTAELAERWRRHPSWVRKLIRSGRLAALKLGAEYVVGLEAVEDFERAQTTASHADEAPKPEAPRREDAAVTTLDGFELPADYEPVFGHLWPGHVPAKRKRPSAVTNGRQVRRPARVGKGATL